MKKWLVLENCEISGEKSANIIDLFDDEETATNELLKMRKNHIQFCKNCSDIKNYDYDENLNGEKLSYKSTVNYNDGITETYEGICFAIEI